jgi:flagellar hook protein FlgE
MAFLRSLFSGVSALRNHQTMMDVIGNNIANVNTAGFKASRASFSELYSQTIQNASRPTTTSGGTNAMQVGLGMSVSSLDMSFNQGSIERTNNDLDLAVFGGGFFVVNNNGQTMYTRDGQFKWDADGRVVTGNGAILQGKMADATGVVPSGTTLEDIKIDSGIKSPAVATTAIKFAGNLNSGDKVYSAGPPVEGNQVKTTAEAYDSLGNKITIALTFTKTAEQNWDWSAVIPAATTGGTATPVGTGTITFNAEGRLASPAQSPTVTITPTSGANPLNLELNFGTVGEFSGITGSDSASDSIVKMSSRDGNASGTLLGVAFDASGNIRGTFSNGSLQTLGQIMLAEFNNPGGLMRAGDNAYTLSANSGTEVLVQPGESSTLNPGAIEQSNVDLADEFTKMITAQRGFQASARVITTSDEFLQEVVNLKR